MPLYEYCCNECGYKFEMLKPISKGDEDTECPRCKNTTKRVLSSFACFSRESNGLASPIAGTSSSCSGCSSTDCSSCH